MTTLVESPLPMAGPSTITPLPFTLDLSCPLNLPSRPLAAGSDWPFQIAGPSIFAQESNEEFVMRRYHETLYLSETLSPLSGFTADLFRIIVTSHSASNPDVEGPLKPLLLSLPQIEHRHRKLILPLLSSTKLSECISQIEQTVIKLALEVRLGSRKALDEGIIPTPKKISDELEKREILMQMILLLLYLTYPPPIATTVQSKKRKRSKHSSSSRTEPDSPTSVNPAEDPKTALELLMDRLSVWQAVSELGLGLGLPSSDEGNKANGKGKGKAEENSIANMLGRFWKTVMLPYFLPKQPDLCSIFHQKIFGHPLPPKLLPPPISSSSTATSTKKPRKPKLTRPIPNSKDSLIPPPPMPFERPRSISNEGRGISRVPSRAGWKAPSENGSFRDSPPRDTSLGMKRSLSRTSTGTGTESLHNIGGMGMRRSRSRSQSIDPHPHPIPSRSDSLSRSISSAALGTTKTKGLVRNQSSGRDLFKGREVGLMRRSMSSKRADPKDESQGRFGLLGRKTSGGRERDAMRKASMEEYHSQSQSQSQPNTLIQATPSKPRSYPNPFFRSQSQSQSGNQLHWIPPTPIQEEQPTPRPNFIAETPIAPSRIARTDVMPLGGIPDEDQGGNESDDPLGELWELTDDEDEDGGRGRGGREMVPETPVR